MNLVRRIAAVMFACAAFSAFAADANLVGVWEFSEDGDTSRIELRPDGTGVVDGAAVKYSADGGKILFSYPSMQGMEFTAAYQLREPDLTINLFDEQTTFKRVGARPAAAAPDAGMQAQAQPSAANPLGAVNPLAARPANPAAGSWSDGAVTLDLAEKNGALAGTLTVAGQALPVAATLQGMALSGTFSMQGSTFNFTADIAENRMTLVSDGNTFNLVKKEVAAPVADGIGMEGGADMFRQPDSGFDIKLAGGFFKMQSQGPVTLFGSKTTPGVIIVMSAPALTRAQIEEGGRTGYQDETLQLTPSGQSQELKVSGGSGIIVPVTGSMQGSPVTGIMVGLENPGHGGMVMTALTTAESWPQLKDAAEATARSIKLYPPQVSDKLRTARQALAGHSLVTSFNNSTTQMNSSGYYTGSAVNSFRAWHCCTSGRGRYEGSRSTSYRGGGVIGSSEGGGVNDGAWELTSSGEGFLLTFNYDNGGTESWTLTVDANENVYVDGTKVKVTTDSICNSL